MSASESTATPSRPTSPGDRGWSGRSPSASACRRRSRDPSARARAGSGSARSSQPRCRSRRTGASSRASPVHGGIDPSCVRVHARVAQIALVVDLDVLRRVERLVREPRDRRGQLPLALGGRVVELAFPASAPPSTLCSSPVIVMRPNCTERLLEAYVGTRSSRAREHLGQADGLISRRR